MAQAIGSARLRAGLTWVFAVGSLCLGSACLGGPHPLPPDMIGNNPHDGANDAGLGAFGNAGTTAGTPVTVSTAGKTGAGAAGAGGSQSPQAADAGEECGDAGAHHALGDTCPRDDDGGALGR